MSRETNAQAHIDRTGEVLNRVKIDDANSSTSHFKNSSMTGTVTFGFTTGKRIVT